MTFVKEHQVCTAIFNFHTKSWTKVEKQSDIKLPISGFLLRFDFTTYTKLHQVKVIFFSGYDKASLYYIGGHPREATIFKFTSQSYWELVNARLPFGFRADLTLSVTTLPIDQKCSNTQDDRPL